MTTLESLTQPLTVRLIDGREFPVKPLDGYGYQLSQSAKGNDEDAIRLTFKLAARAIGMTFDEAFGSEDTVGIAFTDAVQIVAVASGQIKQVEEDTAPFSEPAGATATG